MYIAFKLIIILVSISFIATSAVGLVVFPYAPMHQQGDVFIDKAGQPHSAEEYHYFRIWETSLVVTGSSFGLLAVGRLFFRFVAPPQKPPPKNP
jgi:hypothetical protein